MKSLFIGGMALSVLFAFQSVAQESSLATKARWFSQTSAAAPVPAAPPYQFSYFGENLGLATSSVTITTPGGAVKQVDRVGNNRVFADTAASAAALDQVYGTGTYTLKVVIAGFTATGTAVLGNEGYPAVPQVSNFGALQGVDAAEEFTVNFAPFANAGSDDYAHLVLRDGSGNEVVSEYYYGPESDSISVSADTLVAGRTYAGELSFTHISGRQPDDAQYQLAVGLSSVTTFSVKTSGSGPVDTTPPALSQVQPASGETLANRLLGVTFQFTEAMDTSRHPLVWSATRNGIPFTLDSGQFQEVWADGGKTLAVVYNIGAGGWPENLVVTWTLPGGADGFRDLAGNALVPVTGTFRTSLPTGGGGCDGASPVEAAGFALFKLVNHLQTGSGAPVDDSTNGAVVQAFARITDAPGRAALEFPADPAPKPHQLKFFGQITPGFEFLTQSFATAAALEAAYPAGQYDFQLRDRTTPTTVVSHVVLALTASGYPAVPHFTDYAAAQNVDTNTDFTLTWDAFAGANTTNDSLSVTITDDEGTEVLRLPDSCAGKLLPVTATSAVVPKGLLAAGKTYTAALTFFRVNDRDKLMPGTTSKGITAAGRATRMTLKTAGGLLPADLKFRSLTLSATGDFQLSLDCPVGVPLRLEAATALGAPFSVLVLSTNPPVSPLNLTLPMPPGNLGFLRARTTE